MAQQRLDVLSRHLTGGRLPDAGRCNALDLYRTRGCGFNPTVMRQVIDGATYEYDLENFKRMEQARVFDHALYIDQSRESLREIFVKQIAAIKRHLPLTTKEDQDNPIKSFSFAKMLCSFDQGLFARHTVNSSLYSDTLHGLGTAKHQYLRERVVQYQDYGCFALTELGHGTNAAGVETTATYQHDRREFVLNTPSLLAVKWWIGAAAKTANRAVVFAQLLIDDVNYGIQVFAVPIRNYETHNPLPGIVLGDCGPKIGLEGIDNGFMVFENYRVGYECLLDKFSQIDESGKFHSKIKNKTKRFSAMLAGLLRGRNGVLLSSCMNLRNALTIAIRYSAVRRQFGKPNLPEVPILDYPLQRFRLIPHLANLFAISFGQDEMIRNYKTVRDLIHTNPECPQGEEAHAIMSFLKPLGSAYAQEGIARVRETCGGLGFSAYSYLGFLKSNHDANVTWEGDNSVLIQQTARFIFKNLQRLLKGQPIEAKTLYFLKFNNETVKKEQGEFKAKAELRDNPEMLRRMLLHRASALLDSSMIKLQENVGVFADVGEAWSHTQVHYLRELSKAYGELYLADTFMNRLATVKSTCADTHAILLRIYELYVLSIIERDLGTFREGNYLSSDQGKMVKEYVRDLTWEIGESAVKIIDAIALPDFIVGSVLGHSDGQVYRHLIEAVETAHEVYNLPSWLPLIQQLRKPDS